jgi:uncharacterized protein involved in type VI secretion and phage assembly
MPQAQRLISQMFVEAAGIDKKELAQNLISLEVDDSLLLPDTFTICLRDPGFRWVGSNVFELGKKVEIKANGDDGVVTLLIGEITAIESLCTHPAGPTLTVRGYDQSHRLHRMRQTKTYMQKTDSDMARDIARDCGLRPEVEDTQEVYEYVCQDNQSDYEFLQDRVRRIGFRWYVDDDKLHFERAPESSGTPKLEWGQNLKTFEGRMTTARQVSEVVVRAWDPKNKQEIVGRATTAQGTPEVGETRTGAQAARNAFNIESKEYITNRPVATQAEADALAQSRCDELGNSFIQVEGACLGNPAVTAGTIVELKGVGDRFSGKCRVTHTLHRRDFEGYMTHFTVSPEAHTLGEILNNRVSSKHSVVIGIVTNNNDPDGLGRVKVRFPELPGNEESFWARLVSPMAGSGRGFQFLPEVNDEVLVAFEHNDVNRPFVIGCLWNGQDKPPEKNDKLLNATGEVVKRLIRSRAGHLITLDDSQGDEKISIVDMADKNSFVIDCKNKSVSVKAEGKIDIFTGEQHRILVEKSGGGEKVSVTCGNNTMTVDSAQNSISLESQMQLTLKSQTIEISGTNVSIKADAQMTVESPMTGVKGSGVLTLEGGIIKIN